MTESHSQTNLRPGLPPLTSRMASRPIDERGFPVPWFVAWVDGKPDHRIMDARKVEPAVRHGLCWMCGEKLGVFKTFCIGTMCCITRTISEPPSHRECLQYAVRACPFMTRPHAKRRDAGLPEEAREPAGEFLKRNPGVMCLWTTKTFTPWQPPGGGVLFKLGDPEGLEWWAEGRQATWDEVEASIANGLPSLFDMAREEGAAAMDELDRRTYAARRLIALSFAAGGEDA